MNVCGTEVSLAVRKEDNQLSSRQNVLYISGVNYYQGFSSESILY